MENFAHQSFSTKNNASFVTPLSSSIQSSTTAAPSMADLKRLVYDLFEPNLRENALSVLSKSRMDVFHQLAPLLWNTGCTTAVFLQEILKMYPPVESLELTLAQSTRGCNVLSLLQCVASHPDTKMEFIKANIPIYLYPFLQTTSKLTQFEHLRIASLGVLGALVKVNTKEATSFLLSSEVVPLCLRSMEIGRELSKTVATFILEKLLANEDGLAYVCATAERFFSVAKVLEMVLESLENPPAPRILKLIIACYYRLSHNRRAGAALVRCLPNKLTDVNFINCISEDPSIWKFVEMLYMNVRRNQVPLVPYGGGIDDVVGGPALP